MFEITSLCKSLKYDGKILLKGAKKYTGNFFVTLDSGKKLCLDYEKGFLKKAFCFVGNDKFIKAYEYDENERLINVKKDDKDIFVKTIKHKLGLEYTRNENINNIISRTFDSSNRLIKYVVSPKLIFGFIKYFGDISIDTRYFLNEAKYLGNGCIRLKHLQGDPILNNGVIDKTIVRKTRDDGVLVLTADGKCQRGLYKGGNEQFDAELNYFFDEKGNPIWTHITGKNNKWSYDKKTFYDDLGNKKREIFSECNGNWFTENTFDDKGNVILERRLNASGETIQRTVYKYNDKNLVENESVYDKNNKLAEQTDYEYHPNNSQKSVKTTYFNIFGSCVNLSEYDANSKLIKFTEIYDDSKLETFYDSNDLLIKYVTKDRKGRIKKINEYINDGIDCIKTLAKDPTGHIIYQIEHLKSLKKGMMKNINIFKTPEGELIGKEFIIHNDKTKDVNCIYVNRQGKRVKYKTFCEILGDEV